jgi:hypothetical protein
MTPQTPADTVIYAVGDIHGRLDLLERIQQRIADDAMRRAESRRQVVYLGDYVSRGPDSAGVVDRVREWLPDGFERITLKGNHEDLLLRFLDGEINTGRHWLDYGGLDALAGYGVAIADREARDDASVAAYGRDLAARSPGVPPGLLPQLCASATPPAIIFSSMAACGPACRWRSSARAIACGSAKPSSIRMPTTAPWWCTATASATNPRSGTTASASIPAPIAAGC